MNPVRYHERPLLSMHYYNYNNFDKSSFVATVLLCSRSYLTG